MQFYLAVLDDLVRMEGENPSIGIILCKSKDKTIVEYALKDATKPIGVAKKLQDKPQKLIPPWVLTTRPIEPNSFQNKASNPSPYKFVRILSQLPLGVPIRHQILQFRFLCFLTN
jgi:hypothetical protein